MADGMPPTNPPLFYSHANLADWTRAACTDIAGVLRRGLREDAAARLLLSGGSTPAPVYRALALQKLEWHRVCVGLVDERWLPVGDPDSNGFLIGETLMQAAAAAAEFSPLLHDGATLAECVAAANAGTPSNMPTLLVLGMGPDGHTASLFPGMAGFDAALSDPAEYLAVDASGCPVAGDWPMRITLGAAALVRASQRILLIRGDDKRALFQRALDGIDAREFPVRLAFHGNTPLRVHWCP